MIRDRGNFVLTMVMPDIGIGHRNAFQALIATIPVHTKHTFTKLLGTGFRELTVQGVGLG